MTTDHSKLEMIRALLAKAERTDNDNERDAYNAKASELIAKYGIEQALISAKRPLREMPTTRTWRIVAPYVTDRRMLLAAIGHSLGLPNVGWRRYDAESGKYCFEMTLTGFESDLERVDVLYTSLLVQMAQGVTAARVPWDEDPRVFRKSWMYGFTVIVGRRLQAAERSAAHDANNDAPGTDLVLVDRAAQVKTAFEAANPKLGKYSRQKPNSQAGRMAGRDAGSRANLGQPGMAADSGRRKLAGS